MRNFAANFSINNIYFILNLKIKAYEENFYSYCCSRYGYDC